MKGRLLLVVIALALGAVPAQAQKPPAFEWETLDVPGASASYATAINARGDVAGHYSLDGIEHGFVMRNGVFETIDAPEPTTFATLASAISDTGEVAGIYRYPGACPECPEWLNFQMRGFTWKDGQFEVVHLPGASYTAVSAINVRGDLVGEYWDGTKAYGFVRRDGVFTRLDMSEDAADPMSWSSAYGINARGDIVGWYGNGASWEFHGYLLDKSGALTTIDIPGFTWNLAVALNNSRDVIVAVYSDSGPGAGYRWNDGSAVKLEFPGSAWTEVGGINDNGVVVGWYGTADGQTHGFVARPR